MTRSPTSAGGVEPTNVRYWLLPPGSTEPPKGPFSIEELRLKLDAGTAQRESTVCEVNDSVWRPIAVLQAPPKPSAASPSPAPPSPAKPRSIQGRYTNLEQVARSLQTQGTILKSVGALLLGLAAVGLVVMLMGERGFWTLSVVAGTVLGASSYVSGVLIAAIGEALLALRDIAQNSWPVTSGDGSS